MPHLELENAARAAGRRWVAGVDEVGRGPLAGPVFACAVVFDPALAPPALMAAVQDSKRLARARREALAAALATAPGVFIGMGRASVADITRLNILHASLAAMVRAVAALPVAADYALIDGPRTPDLVCAAKAVVRGDGISASIAAASIVAKVARDRHMVALAERHPGYGWERNAGYGTAEHLSALTRLGVTPEHRPTFAPVFNILRSKQAETPDVALVDSE